LNIRIQAENQRTFGIREIAASSVIGFNSFELHGTQVFVDRSKATKSKGNYNYK
jgi:hypothetical protein